MVSIIIMFIQCILKRNAVKSTGNVKVLNVFEITYDVTEMTIAKMEAMRSIVVS